MYYPKSQIKTNLYTEDEEYIRSDNNQPYKGYYYQTSKGENYTGKTPEDGPNILLIPRSLIDETGPSFSRLNNNIIIGSNKYLILKNINSDQVKNIPQSTFPTPTPQDYINESFVRYFAKKRNEEKYLEIDKTTYDKLVSQDPTYLFELYKPLKLNWQISGDKAKAYQTNETQTALLARRERLPSFIEYFKGNFNQLYALYTQGNTYVIASNGQAYTGFYHIMENGQVMTGKSHTNKGINLVLRDDYIEQEQQSLNPGLTLENSPSLSVNSTNISGYTSLS